MDLEPVREARGGYPFERPGNDVLVDLDAMDDARPRFQGPLGQDAGSGAEIGNRHTRFHHGADRFFVGVHSDLVVEHELVKVFLPAQHVQRRREPDLFGGVPHSRQRGVGRHGSKRPGEAGPFKLADAWPE